MQCSDTGEQQISSLSVEYFAENVILILNKKCNRTLCYVSNVQLYNHVYPNISSNLLLFENFRKA